MGIRGRTAVRAVDTAATVVGVTVAVAVVVAALARPGAHVTLAAAGTLALALLFLFPAVSFRAGRVLRMVVETPVLLLLAATADVHTTVLAGALGSAAGIGIASRRWAGRFHHPFSGRQQLRNVARYALEAVVIATVVARLPVASPARLVAAFAVAAFAGMTVTVGLPVLYARAEDGVAWPVLRRAVVPSFIVAPCAVLLAAVAVLVVRSSGWWVLLLASPAVLLIAGSQLLTAARRERAYATGLVELSATVLDVSGRDEIVAATSAVAASLLAADVRAVPTTGAPVAPGDAVTTTVRIDDDVTLAVSGRRDPLTADERQLLSGLASVCAVALQRSANEAQLRAIDGMKTTLLTAVSHDLRGPLGVVEMTAATLAQRFDELPAERRGPLLDGVARQARRARRIVDDLLDIERQGLAAGRAADATVELAHSCTVAVAVAGALADLDLPNAVTVTVSGPEVSVAVRSDRLERVVENLVVNAAKHSPTGGPVDVSWCVAGDGTARLRVDDAGPGVPDDLRAVLFDPFTQADGSAVAHLGVGLGLYVAHRFVAAAGGHITVGSSPAGGARFEVALPDASTPPATATTAPPPTGASTRTAGVPGRSAAG